MPKVSSEKTSEKREEKKNGWGDGKLFGSENNESTFQGAGFKDKEKALETIRLLEGRDPMYQFQIVNSMYNRAKVILRRTTDKDKRTNLSEAVETFEEWITDFKEKGKGKGGFSYLPIETVQGYKKLADHMGLEDVGFLTAYEEADGDLKKLRTVKVPGKEITWDIERNSNLQVLSTKVKEEFIAPFETDGKLRGLPAKEYVEMIMWGYNSDPSKVKKAISLIDEKINA